MIHPDIPNFAWEELTPPDCTVDQLVSHCCLIVGNRFWDHMGKLQAIRGDWGPLRITSTWRTPQHNQQVGGAENSQHLIWATDIVPTDPTPERIEDLAEAAEFEAFDGIGIYPRIGFLHVDLRGHKARWSG